MTKNIPNTLDELTPAVYRIPVIESTTTKENKTNTVKKQNKKTPEQRVKALEQKKENYHKKQNKKENLRKELAKLLEQLAEDVIVRDSFTIYFKRKKYSFYYQLNLN